MMTYHSNDNNNTNMSKNNNNKTRKYRLRKEFNRSIDYLEFYFCPVEKRNTTAVDKPTENK